MLHRRDVQTVCDTQIDGSVTSLEKALSFAERETLHSTAATYWPG